MHQFILRFSFSRIYACAAVIAFILSRAQPADAQHNVGIGTTSPATTAILDVSSTTKGFLPPRMLQVQMEAISSPAPGLMVYCTDCNPATLYLYSSSWQPAGFTAIPSATFTAGSLACGALQGFYTKGEVMTPANTKELTINAGTGGAYSATTNTVNGVRFTANGTLFASGASSIILKASGTPADTGTFAYTATVAGQSCAFQVTFGGAVFNCGASVTAISPKTLTNGSAHTGSVTLPYTNGNGQPYGSIVLVQQGITLTRTPGTYAASGGHVVYTIGGTHTGSNVAESFTLPEGCTVVTGCDNSIEGAPGQLVQMMYDHDGYGVNGAGINPTYSWCAREVTVTTTAGTQVWLDRNLGAYHRAAAYNDGRSYGSLYQWGRRADGHQRMGVLRGVDSLVANITSTVATTDTPGHGDFIRGDANFDWRSGQNNALWQGMNTGNNNPCPAGFRLPVMAEFIVLINGWTDYTFAIASELRMPMAFVRSSNGQYLYNRGNYWSSTTDNTVAVSLLYSSSGVWMNTNVRASGYSIRCIKN